MNFYKKYLEEIGEKKFRIQQVDKAIYQDLVESFDEITTLSKPLREKISKDLDFFQLKVLDEKISKDWTQKVLFATKDWNKIEAVLMRHDNERNTVCVSCQVWCAQWCTFCATWKLWLKKNLTSDEIIEQVLFFQRKLNKTEPWHKVTNIVYMWMWEPFHNYDEVLDSIKNIHDQKKMWLWARHVTVSTSWVLPKIKEFMKEDLQLNLAISIHAWTDETRSKIMPVNKIYPIQDLIDTLEVFTKKTWRRIFYEYVMLKWVNDSESEFEALWKLLKWKSAHVNIIPYNPSPKDIYECSSRNTMYKFQEILKKYWIPATIRVSLGQDIDGACGQLAAKD